MATIFRSNQYPSSGSGVIFYNIFSLSAAGLLIAAQVVGIVFIFIVCDDEDTAS